MKFRSRYFGRLLQSDLPQERTLSYIMIFLAVACVGLAWGNRSPACSEAGSLKQGFPVQSLSCE